MRVPSIIHFIHRVGLKFFTVPVFLVSVAGPDPDPAFHFDEDPDHTFHSDADLDLPFNLIRIWILPLTDPPMLPNDHFWL
jgi:hypothetical protein